MLSYRKLVCPLLVNSSNNTLFSLHPINSTLTNNIDNIKAKVNHLFPKLCMESINHILKGKKLTYFSNKQKKIWKQRSWKDSKINLDNHSKSNVHNIIRASSIKKYPAFVVVKRKKILGFNYLVSRPSKIILKKFFNNYVHSDENYSNTKIIKIASITKCLDLYHYL